MLSASAELLVTRAEFAALELAQARAQVVSWLALALAASVLAMLFLMALTAAIVLALWPLWGWTTLVPVALVFLLGALVLAQRLRREVREAPPLLAETLGELSKDREALRPRDRGDELPGKP